MKIKNILIKYLTVKGHIYNEHKIMIDYELKKNPLWEQYDDLEKAEISEKAHEEFNIRLSKEGSRKKIFYISAVFVVFIRYFVIISFVAFLIAKLSGKIA